MDKKYKIIVGIAIVGVVIILASMAFLMMSVLNMKQASTNQDESGKVSVSAKKGDALEIIELGDAVTVNIQGEESTQHIVRLVIAFEVNAKDKNYKQFADTFEKKKVVVRDEIIQVVREQTFEMMQRSDAQQKLKDEITQRVNKLLGTQIITQVYFGDFFVQ